MVQPRTHVIGKSKKIKVTDPNFLIYTKKEVILILLFALIASFISFMPLIPTTPFPIFLRVFVFLIILTSSISAKKLVSKKYSIKIEHSLWKFQRYGFKKKYKFKNPIPLGIIFPIALGFLSLGILKPFSFFQYDAENIPSRRLLKSRGSRYQRKEEINESDLAYTSTAGFCILLIIAVFGWLIKPIFPLFGYEITKYSIYYGIWNLLPIGQLDGIKIFFGSFILWFFIAFIYLILLPLAII